MFTRKIIIIIVIMQSIVVIRFLLAYQNRHNYKEGERVSWNILLLSDIDRDSKNITLTTILPNSFPPDHATITIPGSSQIHFGQNITISGSLSKKVLTNKSLVNTISFPNISINQSITKYLLDP